LSILKLFFVGILILLSLLFIKGLDLYKADSTGLVSLKANKLNQIVINNDGLISTINRIESIWEINGKLADTAQINQLIDTYINYNQIDLVSVDPNKHLKYGLGQSSNRWIKFNGKQLFVGRRAGNSRATYVKFSISNKVKKVYKHINLLIPETWRLSQNNPLEINIKELVRVSMSSPSKNIEFKLLEDKWQIDGKEISSNVVEQYLNSILIFKNIIQTDLINVENNNINDDPAFILIFEANDTKTEVKLFKGLNRYLMLYMKKYWYEVPLVKVENSLFRVLEI
jgi:hypothetical protein